MRRFTDPGEQAAFEAGEEAPRCPVCDAPVAVEYDYEKKKLFCPECRESKHKTKPTLSRNIKTVLVIPGAARRERR
jgi:hypothetical protein